MLMNLNIPSFDEKLPKSVYSFRSRINCGMWNLFPDAPHYVVGYHFIHVV